MRSRIVPYSLLLGNALFRGCSIGAISELLRGCLTKSYLKNECVFIKGELGLSCYLVVQGAIGIGSYSLDGRYCLMSELHPGDIFGEMALVDGHPRSADAVATMTSQLLVIRRDVFFGLLQHDARISLNFMEMICARTRRISARADEGYLLDFPTRMARRLLAMAGKEDGPPNDATERACYLTQERLASIIGATRQSVNKQLRAWRSAGIVALSRCCIVIQDAERLRRIAAGSSN